MSDDTTIETVDGSRAEDVLAVVHEAFANRPALDPPATALDESVETVRVALDAHGGLLVEHDGSRAGDVLSVIHEAFSNRPALDPPATALEETVETIRD